jgi:AraC-like DNA-binding protein
MEVNRERIPLRAGDVMVVNPFDTHGGRMCPGDTHVSYACLMLELKPFMLEYKNNCSDLTISMLLEGEYRFPAVIRREEMAAQRIAELIESLQVDYNRAMEQVNPMLECRLMSGVYGLLAQLMALVYPVSETVPNHHDAAFIRSVNQYVTEHYAEALTAKKICAELGYGERNFYWLFRQNFATTFIDYLREFRIQRAAIDYRNSDLSVPEIAAAVGFTDYCYFSRSFKSIIGMTPARYFKQYSSR